MKYLALLILLCSCTSTPYSAQPVLHKQLGQKWMVVPAGTRIGNEVTEHAGVYFRFDVPSEVLKLICEVKK